MKNGSTSTTNLWMKFYYGTEILIEPTQSNYGFLGYNNYWKQLKARHIYFYYDHDYSDSRIKEEVKSLDNSLAKVIKMKAVKYKLKPEYCTKEEYSEIKDKRKESIGFIAQDLMEIVPEVVSYDTVAQLYAISYSRIIPLLVEAIKELNAEVEDLKIKTKDKTGETASELKSAIAPDAELLPGVSEAFLSQNQPNPFNENTSISYFLPSAIQQAVLYIYDMNGKQLKSIALAEREEGSMVIYANELNPGMYYYSLIADGQIIGTKQMILTD